jgi:hypothetical protein
MGNWETLFEAKPVSTKHLVDLPDTEFAIKRLEFPIISNIISITQSFVISAPSLVIGIPILSVPEQETTLPDLVIALLEHQKSFRRNGHDVQDIYKNCHVMLFRGLQKLMWIHELSKPSTEFLSPRAQALGLLGLCKEFLILDSCYSKVLLQQIDRIS